ncbi:hypothetical protein PR048_029845 [Dryococelus australis]|uniref:Uncharacterized protein n=1 Tax=Dryococelus australis TaxID=614101 RepID=A0ABQ9G7A1_9NEOP|nr:hypothetical protein PR048_029845 [Dryococelus australis]
MNEGTEENSRKMNGSVFRNKQEVARLSGEAGSSKAQWRSMPEKKQQGDGCTSIKISIKGITQMSERMRIYTIRMEVEIVRRLSQGEIGNAESTYILGLMNNEICSVCYLLSLSDGNVIEVCKNTFQQTLGLKQSFIQTLQDRKNNGISIYKDKRDGNHRNTKFTSDDHDFVRSNITSFPKDVSHYGRAKTNKFYLCSDLAISRVYNIFTFLSPHSIVMEKFFRVVFRKDFSDLTFHKL